MSTVAIIMTTYNGEQYVGEQIESILASTYQDFELCIFDDGSKDNTMTVLREYEGKYPNKVHAYQNDANLGVTMNFLNAISKTTTDYVMLCDQDDVWKNHKIAITLKRLRHMEAQLGKESPLAVFTDAIVVDSNLALLKHSFFCSGHLNPRKTDLPHLLMENKLIGCTVMINAALRKILQSQSMPKEARYHDWWLGLIAASFGKIGFIGDRTLLYRQHGKNVVGDIGFMAYIKNRVATLEKQKEAIHALQRQAAEFLALYGSELTRENLEIIQHFASLDQKNYWQRRQEIIHYGYWKTGLLRNLGLLLIV